MRISRKYAIISIVLLAAASCIPRKTYLSPAYDVVVADASGKALPTLRVSRFLEDYSTGRDADYSSDAITDLAGRTHFDAVTHWISFATEIFGCLREILQTGAHASCGSHVDVSVDANHFIESARSENTVHGRDHLKSLTIILTSCPSGDWHTCAGAVDQRAKPISPDSR